MTKLLFLSILLLFSSSCEGQNNQIKNRKKEMASSQEASTRNKDHLIGFGCFEGGSESGSVALFSALLAEKNYTSIRNKLIDENPAEKYLATIVCLRLQEKNLIELTKEERKWIKRNKQSSDLVAICSGCTNWDELTIRQLFERNQNFIYDRAQIWLDDTVK